MCCQQRDVSDVLHVQLAVNNVLLGCYFYMPGTTSNLTPLSPVLYIACIFYLCFFTLQTLKCIICCQQWNVGVVLSAVSCQ